jgi:antitoxin PrlF
MAAPNAWRGRKAPVAVVLERISKLTHKGRTTVPKPVREALGVSDGDYIAFRLDERGGVSVVRVDEESDPVLDTFLAFLAEDMKARPEAITALTPELVGRIADLVKGVDFDLDQILENETAI